MMTSELVTRDFWSMRSDEAGTKASENYVALVGSMFRDLTDHRDRNVVMGRLLVGLVRSNTGGHDDGSSCTKLYSTVSPQQNSESDSLA